MESTPLRSGVFAWFSRHKERIGTLAVGHTGKKIEEFLFDWLLYGVVVATATNLWGPWYGSLAAFLIMMPISALICLVYLRLYDWAKVDWFGFELLKEWRDEEEHEHRFGRFLHRLTRLGGMPAFLVLSIHTDPFMTAVYFRHKDDRYKGLRGRDWAIFWSSVVLSNGYWTLRWTVIVQIVLYLWQLFATQT
ncbi:MAG: hypothetical protein HYS26_03100 [Candidatus Kaiserbacteria bacterium]|nr:MAG: hypothetical protein HYS26_03100 [Candidatus Kaiserbacteria bacterium]